MLVSDDFNGAVYRVTTRADVSPGSKSAAAGGAMPLARPSHACCGLPLRSGPAGVAGAVRRARGAVPRLSWREGAVLQSGGALARCADRALRADPALHVSPEAARQRHHERRGERLHRRRPARVCRLHRQAAGAGRLLPIPAIRRAWNEGARLVHQHRCDFCHDRTLAGRDDVPRIAGQREDFLAKTLREYKSNIRPGYDAVDGQRAAAR